MQGMLKSQSPSIPPHPISRDRAAGESRVSAGRVQPIDFAWTLQRRHCAPRLAGIDFADCPQKAPCGPVDRPRA